MADTYTQIFIHTIFVVKERLNIIPSDKKEKLFGYIGNIIKNKGNKLYIVNGMNDHVHALFGLNPNESLSSLIKEVKRMSSMYINKNSWVLGKFEWQAGYGAFSCSKSHTERVFNYIKNQEQHHKKKSFKEEYIEILEKFGIEYENKYLFEDV
ncbi:IS200/IS605 family transposase [Bacteroidetes/Chlorobi group bacterium ChocPot_Mid]|nr:MAG: IS200/IS605 family transposase [Bacteroidetes/Chlorobi group bacterium ChocPot_Mid]